MALNIDVSFTNGFLDIGGSGFVDIIYVDDDGAGNVVIDADGKAPWDWVGNGTNPQGLIVRANAVNSLRLNGYDDWDELYVSRIDSNVFTMLAAPGDIVVLGGAGGDIIWGSDESDWVYTDFLYGEGGDDTIYGLWGDDRVDGGSGNDFLYGDYDYYTGGGGADMIIGGDGNDYIRGGGGADWIFGDRASSVAGGNYNDTIYGDDALGALGDGADLIDGEFGDDKIYGEGGDDVLYGGGKSGSLGGGNDYISGGDGDDDIYGDVGYYATSPASGNDTLHGDGDSDVMLGGDLTDLMDGGSGCDSLYGEGGKDSIYGGTNDDYAEGGAGEAKGYNPVMSGGSGKDTFLPDYPAADDPDLSEPCTGGMGPQMLEGDPVLIGTDTVGFRDQRFTLPFLAGLDDGDLYRYLHYYGMTDEQVDMVRRWRDLLVAGNLN